MANKGTVMTVATSKKRAPRSQKRPEVKPPVEETPVVVEESRRDGIDELHQMFAEVDEEPEPEPVIPPLSVRGTILAPGYWQAFDGELGRINVLAFLGLIFTFVFFPLGILLSGMGLVNARAVPRDVLGRIFGWIGLSFSLIATVAVFFWILFLPLQIAFGNFNGF